LDLKELSKEMLTLFFPICTEALEEFFKLHGFKGCYVGGLKILPYKKVLCDSSGDSNCRLE
jgi:hypothetical protein